MQPENATLKTLAQENAKKMQAKMQAKMQKQCSFWKFVFVKHAHFQNLHFFRNFVCIFFAFCLHFFCILPRFFAIFEKKNEALTKPLPKIAKKNEQMQFAFCFAFLFAFFFKVAFLFAFFCIFVYFFFAFFCTCIVVAFSDCICFAFFLFFFALFQVCVFLELAVHFTTQSYPIP